MTDAEESLPLTLTSGVSNNSGSNTDSSPKVSGRRSNTNNGGSSKSVDATGSAKSNGESDNDGTAPTKTASRGLGHQIRSVHKKITSSITDIPNSDAVVMKKHMKDAIKKVKQNNPIRNITNKEYRAMCNAKEKRQYCHRLVHKYKCQYQLLQGYLLIRPHGSNVIFHPCMDTMPVTGDISDRKIVISFTHVADISRIDTNDLCIETTHGKYHVFKSLKDREGVFDTLQSLRFRALENYGQVSSAVQEQEEERLEEEDADGNENAGDGKETNREDACEVNVDHLNEAEEIEEDEIFASCSSLERQPSIRRSVSMNELDTTINRGPIFDKMKRDGSEDSSSASDNDDSGDELSHALSSMKDFAFTMKQQTQLDEHVSKMKVVREGEEEESKAQTSRRNKSARTFSTRFFLTVAPLRTDGELREQWKKLKCCVQHPMYKENALQNVHLECTYDEFYRQFWSTNASHPIESYQGTVVGDFDIITTPWTVSKTDGFTLERCIRYTHPFDASVGPPHAHATKEQRLQKFGHYGLMLHTTTAVQDVPMTDCFVLEDRMLVEPTVLAEGQHEKDKNSRREIKVAVDDIANCGTVTLTAQIGVRFVKSTMWKKVIETNAKNGITKWLKGYRKFIEQSVSS